MPDELAAIKMIERTSTPRAPWVVVAADDKRAARLLRLGGCRNTAGGILMLEATGARARERNRAQAIARLRELMANARVAPRPRRPTKPTKASKERWRKAKKARSATKRSRGKGGLLECVG